MEETIRKILDMAKTAAAVIDGVTGTHYADAAVKAGQAILDLVNGISGASDADQAELEATRTELEAKVNAHVDSTIGRLRGE